MADPNRPAWLPENFATPEAFAKSNADLQAEFTRTRQELAKLKGEPVPETPASVVPPVDPLAIPPVDEATRAAADLAAKTASDDAAAAEAAKLAGFDTNPYQT